MLDAILWDLRPRVVRLGEPEPGQAPIVIVPAGAETHDQGD